MTQPEFLILFILPFATMTIVMLIVSAILPAPTDMNTSGRLANFNGLYREAYVGTFAAAIVAVIAFHIRGGPEPFVLVWMPLLSTVMILPFGYAAALFIGGIMGKTRTQ